MTGQSKMWQGDVLPENTPIITLRLRREGDDIETIKDYADKLHVFAKAVHPRFVCVYYFASQWSGAEQQKWEEVKNLCLDLKEKSANNLRIVDIKSLDFNKEYDTSYYGRCGGRIRGRIRWNPTDQSMFLGKTYENGIMGFIESMDHPDMYLCKYNVMVSLLLLEGANSLLKAGIKIMLPAAPIADEQVSRNLDRDVLKADMGIIFIGYKNWHFLQAEDFGGVPVDKNGLSLDFALTEHDVDCDFLAVSGPNNTVLRKKLALYCMKVALLAEQYPSGRVDASKATAALPSSQNLAQVAP